MSRNDLWLDEYVRQIKLNQVLFCISLFHSNISLRFGSFRGCVATCACRSDLAVALRLGLNLRRVLARSHLVFLVYPCFLQPRCLLWRPGTNHMLDRCSWQRLRRHVCQPVRPDARDCLSDSKRICHVSDQDTQSTSVYSLAVAHFATPNACIVPLSNNGTSMSSSLITNARSVEPRIKP